jgi:hypothetical protein
MAIFKPAAGSHDVNPLFLAFLKNERITRVLHNQI